MAKQVTASRLKKIVPVADVYEAPVTTTKNIMQDKGDVKQAPIQVFIDQLGEYQKRILPDLLKKHNISPEQFAQTIISEVKRDEKLLMAFVQNPSSMFAAILAGAEIGLIPSALTGEFYLIPRKIDGKLTVCPQIGYPGLVSILLRSGDIIKIHTEIVYKDDEFEPIYGLEPNIIHKRKRGVEKKSADITDVYAVAKLKSGDYQIASMTRKEIMAVINMSLYDNKLYFNDEKDPNMWMLKKIAIVQLSKLLPKDYYSKQAIMYENKLQTGAILTLDEDKNIKIIENDTINNHPKKEKKSLMSILSQKIDQ